MMSAWVRKDKIAHARLRKSKSISIHEINFNFIIYDKERNTYLNI